ncbi:integral membrane protein [Bacillus atrophaeus]|nr:integral membrane protein [Bacillus atrophaeus]
MLQTPIGRLRTMGFIEGMSLLILLFIAMPLKYWADLPLAVTIVGSVHGGLFVLYLLVLAYVTLSVKWSLKWSAARIRRRFCSIRKLFV